MNILVVEDEPKVSKALGEGLRAEGYEVTRARTGEEAFFLANERPFDLIILDIMLPGRSGIEILQALRKKHSPIPVLLLTAKDTVEDRVIGLDAGADDYVIKPFAFSELCARIRALLRRGKPDSASILKAATLEMDLSTRSVTRDAQAIQLTVREFELLEFLLRNKNRIVSREVLARDVWKETNRATPLNNVIDVHMTRLRKKVDDPFKLKLIQTVRGVGFVLREDGQ
jgi:DNA-binding response OmpR family regulator